MANVGFFLCYYNVGGKAKGAWEEAKGEAKGKAQS